MMVKTLKDFSMDEIEEYLNEKGFSVLKTEELDYLEDKLRNYPG